MSKNKDKTENVACFIIALAESEFLCYNRKLCFCI